MKFLQSPYAIYLIMRGWLSLFFALWLTVVMLYHTTMITGDPLQLVIIGVVLEGTTFLFEVPTGVFADTLGRRFSIIVGISIIGAGFVIEGLFPVLPAVLLGSFLWGVGFTFYSGANDAWITDEIGIERANQAFLRGTQVSLLAGLLGIVIATVLGSVLLNLPIVISGIGHLALAAFLFVFMPETGFKPVRQHPSMMKELRHTFGSSIKLVQRRPSLKYVLLIGITIGLSVGGFDRLYTAHFIQNFTLPFFEPVIWFGLIDAIKKILTILTVEMARRRLNTLNEAQVTKTLSWMYLGTITGNLFFALTGNFIAAMGCFLISQSLRESSKPIFMAWINRQAEPQVRATVISMYWQSNALGNIFGAPIIGVIGTVTSLRVALTAAALALSPALWFYRQTRRMEPDKLPPLKNSASD